MDHAVAQTNAQVAPTVASMWLVVGVIKALLVVIGAFALACSTFSMFFREADDHVVVGAIFFSVFAVCIVGVGIVAALHRVVIVIDESKRRSL